MKGEGRLAEYCEHFPPNQTTHLNISSTIHSPHIIQSTYANYTVISSQLTPSTQKQLGDEKSQDKFLEFYANAGDVLVISVGYRLAPEHPYPAPVEDCVDAVEYLLKYAERDFGVSGRLRALAGEVCLVSLSSVSPQPDYRHYLILDYIHFLMRY